MIPVKTNEDTSDDIFDKNENEVEIREDDVKIMIVLFQIIQFCLICKTFDLTDLFC